MSSLHKHAHILMSALPLPYSDVIFHECCVRRHLNILYHKKITVQHFMYFHQDMQNLLVSDNEKAIQYYKYIHVLMKNTKS